MRADALVSYDKATDTITYRVARELISPNRWIGGHWAGGRGERAQRQAWTGSIANAVAERGRVNLAGPLEGRRRLDVARILTSRRKFIRDDDNLYGSLKPLIDALVRIKILAGDTREQLAIEKPTQELSSDGATWTVIKISPADVAKPTVIDEIRRRVLELESCDWTEAEAFAGERLVSRAEILKILDWQARAAQ